MLAFIDDKYNIKVYSTVRKMKRITVTFSFGKCVISSPYKLPLSELKSIYNKNETLANKYQVDFNNLYVYVKGVKYKLFIYNSSHNRVYIENDVLYCASTKNNIEHVIKLLKSYYNDIVRNEILKIKDKVILKIKNVFNVDLSNIEIDYKYATTYLGCNNHRNITMSGILAKYDVSVYEYVLAHEYVHQFVFNHGNDFYDKLLKLYPDYLIVMRNLKNKGKEFSFSII